MLETEQRIVAAAKVVFSEHGYGGASTRAIAAEAKVNEATIFRLFGDKRGLFGRVLEGVVAERTITPLLLDVHQQSPEKALELLCEKLVAEMVRSRDNGDYKLLLHVGLDEPALLKGYAEKIRQPLFATLGRLLNHLPPVEQEAISRLIVGTLWYEVVVLPLLGLASNQVSPKTYSRLFAMLFREQKLAVSV